LVQSFLVQSFAPSDTGSDPDLSRHAKPSCPAQAGHPVRRGLSIQSLLSLEYWIARSRLRQGFDEALPCWRAEALAKAASRAMTTEYAFAISRRDAPEA
jgi:hypothetical protein